MRNPNCIYSLATAPHPDHDTVYAGYEYSFEKHKDNACIGTRADNGDGPYVWKTYGETKEISTAFGSGVLDLCPVHTVDDRDFRFIGINSKNREEWFIADIACVFYNITIVPFYDTLGADTVTYILNQTELETILVSEDKVPTLIELKQKNETGNLQNIIQMEALTPERRREMNEVGFNAFSFEDIINMGRHDERDYIPAKVSDILCFSYTSGTTGDPKGAMLSHGNIMAALSSVKDYIQFCPDDRHLSYLPMPHIMEKAIFATMMYFGARVGAFNGDILKLKFDLAELKPTYFPSVPRLWGRMYDVISGMFREAEGAKKALIEKALASKMEHLHKTGECTHGLWDSLVFKKTKAVLGGHVRLCLTGSAPMKAEVLDFLKVCFCAPMLEGYGQTESSGAVTVTNPLDTTSGHVGGPTRGVEIKLVDIPDMNYFETDILPEGPRPRGELCFRGPLVIPGYFKMSDKTAEAIDSDGWLHSGDVGMLLPNGSFKVIDRKKNIFKLSQGEYVAPEKVEGIMSQLPIVAQIFVHGDSIEAFVVAIVVPDEPNLLKWASAEGHSGGFTELCALEETKNYIHGELTNQGRAESLLGFEIPKTIHIHNELFTPESDILTPTFKLKRNIAAKVFRPQIDAMYGK